MARGPEAVAFVGTAEQPGTLPGLLHARAELTPDARFISHVGVSLSYAEMLARASVACAALADLGVARGDRVAVMLPNCLEFLDIWFGAMLRGAVLVPINTALKGEGLRYIVEHSDPAVAVVDATTLQAFDASVPAGQGPSIRFARGASGQGWESLEALLAGSHPLRPPEPVDPGDTASILYTSGTTGLPKGVMNCHNAYLAAANQFTRRHVRVRPDDVFYTSLPLFHVNAQMLTTVGSLVSGRPMVLAPTFSASRFFDDIRASGATVFNYIGAMLTMLFKQPLRPGDAMNPVRLAIGGAAPKELWAQFETRFDLTILEIYGLTETATYCLGSPPDDIRIGKLGLPVSWADVEIHRDDGSEAEFGEAGEIVIRAKRPDVLFRGYYGNEAATETAMRGGWFHSGDRGRRESDGYFVFIDRLKDSIRRRGENISSYEVEMVVNSHPAVAESAAVGVPSELGEEDVMTVVVIKPDLEFDPAELVAHCAERMASFMVPRYVKVVPQLPKTATERVQKFSLRELGIGTAWDAQAEPGTGRE